jgi:hypothetical protein
MVKLNKYSHQFFSIKQTFDFLYLKNYFGFHSSIVVWVSFWIRLGIFLLKIEIFLSENPENCSSLYTNTPTIIPTIRVMKNPIHSAFFLFYD